MAKSFSGETYNPKGKLVIIGGHEEKDKSEQRKILKEVAKNVGNGKLVIATVASRESQPLWRKYKKVFTDLGVKKIMHLSVNAREEAFRDHAKKVLKNARGVFFTGGDQLCITSGIGGTEICQMLHELYLNGGIIAGTSAGASVMGTEMLVSGNGDETTKSIDAVHLAPGLGFVMETIFDQHFAERGRISRLLAAVALNPKHIGIGIDEDTAIILSGGGSHFKVIGSGGVYIVDCKDSTHSNVAERSEVLSVHNARIHLLSDGGIYDLQRRQPVLKGKRKLIHKVENRLSYQ